MPYSPPFDVPEVPGIFLAFSNALQVTTPDVPHRAVVIGTRLPAGSVAENVPKQLLSAPQAEAYWGQGSMVAEMVKAFLAQGNGIELWGIGVDEEGLGVASAGDVAVAGAATVSGTLSLWVAGVRVRVGVTKGDTAAAVVTNAVTELGDEPTLPVTAADGVTSIDLTCRWKGISGDNIDIRLDPDGTVPDGITITITAMTGGATDPEIDATLTALGDAKYDTVVSGYVDLVNINHVDAFLEPRWGALVQKEGQGFFAHTGSYSDLTSLAGSLNSKFITVIAPSNSPTPQWVIASASGAADALLTKRRPNAPRKGIVLEGGVRPAAPEDSFPQEQRDTLLDNGISTATRTANGSLILERVLTTNTQDDNAFTDKSYAEIAVMRLLGRIRYDLQVWRARFNDWVVSSDETHATHPKVMTPGRLRQFLTGQYKVWLDAAFVQDLGFFSSNLVVEVAANKTDFNIFIPLRLVYPLNAMAGELAFV